MKAHSHTPSQSATPTAPLVTISLDTEIGGWDYDPETGEPIGPGSTIANAIIHQSALLLVKELKDTVTKAAAAKANDEISSQVRELVTDVLNGSFTVTDKWGSSSGTTTTIRERIAEQVAKELKPASRDGYYGNPDRAPVITVVIEEEVKKALSTELRATVAAARDKVVTAVRDHAAELISKAVKDGLK